MNFDITDIIECVIALLSAVISAFLIPYLKTQLSENKRAKLKFWLKVAVEAAEQLFGSKTGQQKKEYVVSFLLSKGLVFDIDEVTALIESEVYKLTGKSE
ncbi:MAG: holin [Clostridia bacterium]|nr:holin [Clostridia bacterium]